MSGDYKAGLAGQLQDEQLRVAQLTEQAPTLQQRLADQEGHRQSLEEKHEHARQALDHVRQAAKEQRDQDGRRHEQQVQQLQAEVRKLNGTLTDKLTELTQLNRNAAALTAEVGVLRQQLGQIRAEKERAERDAGKAQEQIAWLFVAGDFNDWRGQAHQVLLPEAELQEAFVQGTGRAALSFPVRMPVLQLDRIYYRNAAIDRCSVLRSMPWTRLSDHLPLIAEVRVQ